MGPVSYYIIMIDIHFLKYLLLCCDICVRLWRSFLCHVRLMSIQTPFLLQLFTDSVPAALRPTWSAANLQQEEMIKGGRDMRDWLCSAPMCFPGLSTPPSPWGSSHMSGILAKPQLTRSWFSVYMPGHFSSVCSGTEIHSLIFDRFVTTSGRLLTKMEQVVDEDAKSPVFDATFLLNLPK